MNVQKNNGEIKKIISVIGYANKDKLSKKIHSLAYNLGKSIVDKGYILANGGLGGIMEVVSKGARDSINHKENSIIGILPNYDKNMANAYIDIALPIGFDVGRNISLISISDAVIVMGGGAGTLNEITLAWQMNKLIIALGDFGWGGKLADTSLDDRRNDKIHKANSVKEALNILETKIAHYHNMKFNGISNVMSKDEALSKIASYCSVNKSSLNFLGKGSEGFVFTDKNFVYKIFKPNPKQDKLYFHLSSLAYTLNKLEFVFHHPFHIVYKDECLIIYYKYEKSREFTSASKEQFQALLNDCYFAKIVHLDLQPKNLCKFASDETLFICDIGYDLYHFTQEFFESMCRRAFAIYKLQNHLKDLTNVKQYLSPLNKKQDFSKLEKFLKCSNLDDRV